MKPTKSFPLLSILNLVLLAFANAQDQPYHAKNKPADMTKPVQVFILMGQSNMVGAGKLRELIIKTLWKMPLKNKTFTHF